MLAPLAVFLYVCECGLRRWHAQHQQLVLYQRCAPRFVDHNAIKEIYIERVRNDETEKDTG